MTALFIILYTYQKHSTLKCMVLFSLCKGHHTIFPLYHTFLFNKRDETFMKLENKRNCNKISHLSINKFEYTTATNVTIRYIVVIQLIRTIAIIQILAI